VAKTSDATIGVKETAIPVYLALNSNDAATQGALCQNKPTATGVAIQDQSGRVTTAAGIVKHTQKEPKQLP
jgi:hypothetical protein